MNSKEWQNVIIIFFSILFLIFVQTRISQKIELKPCEISSVSSNVVIIPEIVSSNVVSSNIIMDMLIEETTSKNKVIVPLIIETTTNASSMMIESSNIVPSSNTIPKNIDIVGSANTLASSNVIESSNVLEIVEIQEDNREKIDITIIKNYPYFHENTILSTPISCEILKTRQTMRDNCFNFLENDEKL